MARKVNGTPETQIPPLPDLHNLTEEDVKLYGSWVYRTVFGYRELSESLSGVEAVRRFSQSSGFPEEALMRLCEYGAVTAANKVLAGASGDAYFHALNVAMDWQGASVQSHNSFTHAVEIRGLHETAIKAAYLSVLPIETLAFVIERLLRYKRGGILSYRYDRDYDIRHRDVTDCYKHYPEALKLVPEACANILARIVGDGTDSESLLRQETTFLTELFIVCERVAGASSIPYLAWLSNNRALDRGGLRQRARGAYFRAVEDCGRYEECFHYDMRNLAGEEQYIATVELFSRWPQNWQRTLDEVARIGGELELSLRREVFGADRPDLDERALRAEVQRRAEAVMDGTATSFFLQSSPYEPPKLSGRKR